MSRRPESPFSSRQPRILFSSPAPAADNERGSAVAGGAWTTRCYSCSFCGREFNSAQALGGHMNIHRRDRARLRTSTAQLASVPHHADSPPAPQINAPQSSHAANLYLYPMRDDSPPISSGHNAYSAPTVISASAAFRQHLDTHPSADPTLLALAPTHPSHDENSVAESFTGPLIDLVPSRTSATRFSKTPSEAHSLSPSTAPHAVPLRIRPMLENSSLQPVEALNIRAGQVSTRQAHQDCSGTKAVGGAQLQHIQFLSQSTKGRPKRARAAGVDAVTSSSDVNSTVQCSGDDQSSTSISSFNKSNLLHAAAADAPRRPPSQIKELICLDLELRLGQSSASDSGAPTAGNCCVRTAAQLSP